MTLLNWNSIKGPLTVVTVIVVIIFITYTSQIFVIWPYLGPANLHSVFTLVPLNFFVAMVLVNYILTCRTNPGSVPNRWVRKFYLLKLSMLTVYHCRCLDNKHTLKLKNQPIHHGFARHATTTNHQEHIIAHAVTDACSKWITIVRGSTIVSASKTTAIFFDFSFM